MRTILILGPYILIPWLAALSVKGLNKFKGITYLVTVIIFLIYPLLVTKIDDHANPPSLGPRHDDAQQFYLIGSYIFLLPIALFIQFLANLVYFKKTTRKSDR